MLYGSFLFPEKEVDMATEEQKKATMEAMKSAAEQARTQFMEKIVLGRGTVKDVGQWIEDNYMAAGYKRLCAILMEYSHTKE